MRGHQRGAVRVSEWSAASETVHPRTWRGEVLGPSRRPSPNVQLSTRNRRRGAGVPSKTARAHCSAVRGPARGTGKANAEA
ncbi:hypothetical protein GCM10009579_14460 [Streptomyces javensis]|uniref:Uncharacterized protein n=1 Tax=Streptomyces javensis TaxID=114698 RepID=A0ABN1WQV2_9ACTN